jgi:hypothetical protein
MSTIDLSTSMGNNEGQDPKKVPVVQQTDVMMSTTNLGMSMGEDMCEGSKNMFL